MNGLQLAPIKGYSANAEVELEPLASLLTSFERLPLNDSSSIPLLRPTPVSINQYQIPFDSKKKSPFRNDINQLWSIYLKQQQDTGVDISNKQAMAKAYYQLDEKELNILRKVGKSTSNTSLLKKRAPASARITIDLRKRLHKPVNRRQKRKKMIRDELKRQLNTFTTIPKSEGFPWKAILSKKGYRNLKLEGWPRNIPISKRIDDFNPVELDKFEQSIKNGSIKIVNMHDIDE
ncbi:hypothetical protein MFLAVUS_005531 [Mucor flavus]|uniref:Uncharacterized protein n=1 Tax=Mucor flavus TaxID=439312 RepID=A0ABP9YYZ5_9FUNG